MASPQKENGHLDLANELVDKLGMTKLSGSEWQILFVVWRKTWAWKKKEDWISLTQLEQLTGLSRVMICRSKKKLVNRNILVQTENGLSFNKNYDSWVVNESTPLVNKKAIGSKQKDNLLVNKNTHTKETITKETHTKEILSPEATGKMFVFEDKLKTMFSSKDRRMNIIAYYWTIKGFKFTNEQQYFSALKRELRPSQLLIGYNNDQIKRTCQWLKQNADFKWTLETVGKYIDEPLENLKAGGKPKTEEDLITELKRKYERT